MATLGVVIQVGPGRIENLELCLCYLSHQSRPVHQTVLVADGPTAWAELTDWAQDTDAYHRFGCQMIHVPKWTPGGEQPRNAGVRMLRTDIAWFVDTDILLHPNAAEAILDRWQHGVIVVCPYEWMAPGERAPLEELRNDPRWDRFHEPGDDWRDDASAGLSCFGGNLAWDRREFERLGGFWNLIHRGEDGELGLRAVEAGLTIRYAPAARGWHLWHPIDRDRILKENARNVPMIDARHAKLLGKEGYHLSDADGASLAQTCPACGAEMPCNTYWSHRCEEED